MATPHPINGKAKSKANKPPSARHLFGRQLTITIVFLLLSVWACAVWIFSSAFKQPERVSHLRILVADLDGGQVGESLVKGCASISAEYGTASFVPVEGPNVTYDSIYGQVWRGHYWGAIIAMPNATRNFWTAIEGENDAYGPSAALQYIYNEARWATMSEGFIIPSISSAISEATSRLQQLALHDLDAERLNATSVQALLNGVDATGVNIAQLGIGIKVYLNTVGMVFPIIIEFFLSMALTGIIAHSAWPNNPRTRSVYLIRLSVSLFFSCLIGISWGLWFEIFHESKAISGGQYCLVWLTYWIYSFIAFLVLDTASAFMPMPFLPICVLAYIIINVSATVFPIDVKPAFFHLDYIWPSYNCFELLVTTLSHGSTSRVYRNVPVLLGWLVVWGPLNWLAARRRATIAGN